MRTRHDGKPLEDRNDWQTIKSLLPYLWEFRGRVLLAMAFLIAAKLANVGVPLLLKEVIDALSGPQALLTLPVLLLVGYGALPYRCSSICTTWRCAFTWNARPAACRATSSAARPASVFC